MNDGNNIDSNIVPFLFCNLPYYFVKCVSAFRLPASNPGFCIERTAVR
jgi:hypothetical protein